MDNEGGVKAPMTRRRRRLSVEQSDDGKSSPAPNTPTKKRAGRTVAKPELDLIDENAPDNDNPKKFTKKTNMKELDVEEKPVTPSRRSARIKSNSSIVLETTQAIDSPRAKRASRRNSQIGSDNETPITPARHTRRTRQDSASNDQGELQPGNKPIVLITERIIEEQDTVSENSQSDSVTNIEQKQSPSTPRKSPRLSLKKNKEMDLTVVNEKELDKSEKSSSNTITEPLESNLEEINKSDENNVSNKENETTADKQVIGNTSPHIMLIDISNNILDLEKNKLSISNIELLKTLDTETTNKKINLNKSSSALTGTQTQSYKHKIYRTRSWTGLSDPVKMDDKCYSDTEGIKKIKKNLSNDSINSNAQNVSENNKADLNNSNNKTGKIVRDITKKFVETNLSNVPKNKEKSLSSLTSESIHSPTANLFNKEPTDDMQTSVYIDESDSNSEKIHIQDKDDNQSVSIGRTHFHGRELAEKEEKNESSQDNEKNSMINKNDSCEPMDVDETLPDNTTINKLLLKTMDMSQNEDLSKANDEIYCGKENYNNRRSSLTLSTSQALDKTANENKSTLILSQLKDISNEHNISQSLEITTDKKVLNSDQVPNLNEDNEHKNNLSITYLTSTPLQQKSLIKHAVQANTSGIVSNNTSKIDKNYSDMHVSNINESSNKSDESESDEESSQKESDFMDNEAEDASDDYESGDSRDNEERQYERDHEIIQEGETLTSEDELSNDTDYEKDSFVVSSDQDDNDLLDGSGDDLSMSDNELKMTTESKKKYNKRKLKEQKKASKEMFESRHKLNVSNKSDKLDSSKIKKKCAIIVSSDSEDENIKVKIKKSKRMRLDSSQENNINNTLENTCQSQLSKSLRKSIHNESDDVDNGKGEMDPLSTDFKKESKSPYKRINTSIQFIDTEHSEDKVGVSNKSQSNITADDDPLEESNTSESSNDSNNINIQNYDSILNDLNKSRKTKKDKNIDISLNIDKKTKQKSVPIVDQLNLTQVKLKKQKQNEITLKNSKQPLNDNSKKKHSINKLSDDEVALINSTKPLTDISKKSDSRKEFDNVDTDNESSASIDLHLLFSEDSNNSEDVEIKDKKSVQSNEDDSVIPTKKNHDKSDISEISKSKVHTESAKKTKKRNRSMNKSGVQDENSDVENNLDETEVQFFVDTIGTHSTTVDDTFNISARNKKENSMAVEDSDSDAPIEVSNKSIVEAQEMQVDDNQVINTSLAAINKSKTKTPKSDKKKKRIDSLTEEPKDAVEIQIDVEDNMEMKGNLSGITDKSINKSVSKTPKSDKKKSKRMSQTAEKVSQTADVEEENSHSDTPLKISNEIATKVHKHKADIEDAVNTSSSATNKSLIKTPKSDKKKNRSLIALTTEETEATDNQPNTEDDIEEKVNPSDVSSKSINKSITKTPKSEKKKARKMSESEPTVRKDEQVTAAESSAAEDYDILDNVVEEKTKTGAEDKSMNKSTVKTPKSDKKKKKLSESQADIQISNDRAADTDQSSLNNSIKKKSRNNVVIIEDSTTYKASKASSSEKKISKILDYNDTNDEANLTESKEVVGSKKRKRKSTLNQKEKEPESEGLSSYTCPSTTVSNATVNKKRKISQNTEDLDKLDRVSKQIKKIKATEKETKQEKQRHLLHNQVNNKIHITDLNINKKESKKRKEREDDEGSKMAKVLKLDNNVKLQVPRLPANVLDQLEDRPTKKTHQVTKRKAVSTTNFVVEKTKGKKTKPSNFLEESIYLNEEEKEPKTRKQIKNPKVLPFLPTVLTSNCGFTTNFKVNTLPKEIQFVAKSTSVSNYKNDYLQNKKIKRLGTYELYKRNRNIKMSKF